MNAPHLIQHYPECCTKLLNVWTEAYRVKYGKLFIPITINAPPLIQHDPEGSTKL